MYLEDNDKWQIRGKEGVTFCDPAYIEEGYSFGESIAVKNAGPPADHIRDAFINAATLGVRRVEFTHEPLASFDYYFIPWVHFVGRARVLMMSDRGRRLVVRPISNLRALFAIPYIKPNTATVNEENGLVSFDYCVTRKLIICKACVGTQGDELIVQRERQVLRRNYLEGIATGNFICAVSSNTWSSSFLKRYPTGSLESSA